MRGSRLHRLSTLRFIPKGCAVPRVLILDTRVYLKDGWIRTDLRVKPTDRHQFLCMGSCHPKHCKTAIPYSQVLRLRWICSEYEDYEKRVRDLKHYLLKCRYNEQLLNHELQRALDTPRDRCLQSKRNQDKSARTSLVVTYHSTLPSLHWTTKHHLSTLHTLEQLQKALPLPPLITFWRLRNLRDYLVRAALTPTSQEPLGNRPCGTSRCKTCPIMLATDEFSSYMTGQHFKIKVNVYCKSSNITYLIICGRCRSST